MQIGAYSAGRGAEVSPLNDDIQATAKKAEVDTFQTN